MQQRSGRYRDVHHTVGCVDGFDGKQAATSAGATPAALRRLIRVSGAWII
jgi:hypothetical protein